MTQIARNLTDAVDGFFKGKRYLIHDRDPLYTQQFLSMLAEAGMESVKLPPRSPGYDSMRAARPPEGYWGFKGPVLLSCTTRKLSTIT
jgi:hypothetical protein